MENALLRDHEKRKHQTNSSNLPHRLAGTATFVTLLPDFPEEEIAA